MEQGHQIFPRPVCTIDQCGHRGDDMPQRDDASTCTHHATVGMPQQDRMTVEERSVAATLSSLHRAEKEPAKKTESI